MVQKNAISGRVIGKRGRQWQDYLVGHDVEMKAKGAKLKNKPGGGGGGKRELARSEENVRTYQVRKSLAL